MKNKERIKEESGEKMLSKNPKKNQTFSRRPHTGATANLQFPFDFSRPASLVWRALGWAFKPINSNPIISIINGNERIRKGALHGFRIAVVMWAPNRSEGDVWRRCNSLRRRMMLVLSSICSPPVQFLGIDVMLLSCWFIWLLNMLSNLYSS